MGCRKSLPEVPLQENKGNPYERDVVLKKPPVRRESLMAIKEQAEIKDSFEVLKVIGSTHNGILLSARDLRSGTIRSINEISKSYSVNYGEILREVSILNSLDHPNILKCYQTLESSKSIYIVLESTDGGPLQNRIKSSCNEVLVAKYMRDIFSALNYMHVSGVIHCNLHINNILLSNDSQDADVKIVGFTHSQKKSFKDSFDISNLQYEFLSPELLENDYDEKTDIWSAGIIVYLLLVQKLPFTSKRKKEVLESIYSGNLDFENPTFLALSHNAQDFIKKLLKKDKNERLSAKDALGHAYLYQSSQEVALSYEVVQKLRRFKVI